jgi:thiol-disulfide isomerase/thioredoxin
MNTIKLLAAVLIVTGAFALSSIAQTPLVGLDGTRVDIQGQRGKVVILAVGASWLPLSDKQAEYANALAKKYAGRNVEVFFVSTDSTNAKSKNFATNEDIKKFATANKLNVTVLRDSDGVATLKKFSIDQIPSFVILDKNGNMVGEALGGIDPKYDITVPISKTVDRLL